nr:hypothetical protein [Tanacetum cinerariifolium]
MKNKLRNFSGIIFFYSKVEGVPKTIYEVNSISDQGHIREPDKKISEDPFRIYNILHKNQPHGDITAPSSSLSHPPGFTPVDLAAKTGNVHSNEVVNDIPASVNSPLIDVEVVNSPQEVHMEVPKGSIGQSVNAKGGSVLGVLEEVIRVGQAMGFAMKGCEKDIEAIIGNQGAGMVFRWICSQLIFKVLNFFYSKVEGVPETIYEVNSISDQGHIREPDKKISEDPFGIYNILHKNQPHGDITAPSSSLSHPPGFIPVDLAAKTGNVHSNEVVNDIPASVNSPLIDVEVVNSPQEVHMEVLK